MVGHHTLDGHGGGHRGRAEEVVAAALAVRVVVLARRAPGLHRVADVGQRVVLGEDAQDGPARAPGGDEGGGHSGDAAFDGEAFVFQDFGEVAGGLVLLQRDLGEVPEARRHFRDEVFQGGGVGEGGRLAFVDGLGGGGGGGERGKQRGCDETGEPHGV